ncbi:histone-lysine n-methyltransferase setmar-like protein [Elysia marginata]|uniref:Histone-lysine n-methyltransferase setmar-like protein n=1 Tax=Elysia marginata TaxID=1093978 RepID=A0AAV4G1M0_9GAST|nr:histone-lysine n-methyltransferase setmar-like protein [Elysia marginata]
MRLGVYSWDPETKRQSAEWRDFDEPCPEKVRRKQEAFFCMHMIFFDMNGVILRWPVPIGTTIKPQYYKKELQDKLRLAIRKKRPGLLESGILFHHDNAPVHTALVVTDILAGHKWELLEHHRYSPDLAPCDFHLFSKMKEHLRGQRLETEEDIIQATKNWCNCLLMPEPPTYGPRSNDYRAPFILGGGMVAMSKTNKFTKDRAIDVPM